VKKIHFTFPEPPHTGKRVLTVTGVAKHYGGNAVFQDVSFELFRGEKIVVVGPNGAGKSTLLRVLAGVEEPSAGLIERGEKVEAGYFAVDLEPPAAEALPVLDFLETIAPADLHAKLRGLLGAFLFSGDDAFKPVSVLSGGERNRLLLLALLVHPRNLLILDEPTNHLDMTSKDVLLDALSEFSGTVLFVSHDRSFIEKLADRVLEMGNGCARMYNGDYAYYRWKKEQENGEFGGTGDSPGAAGGEDFSQGKKNHLQSKRLRSELRKLEREEEEILERIDRLTEENRSLQHRLADETVYRDGERVKELKSAIHANTVREQELLGRWQELEAEKTRLLS